MNKFLNFKLINSKYLCIFFLLISESTFTQSLNNIISISYSRIWFPNRETSINKSGLKYSNQLNENFTLSLEINLVVGGKYIEFLPSDSNIYETIIYNEISDRSLLIFDCLARI